MNTLLIQITNQKAVGLLHELEELHLIKVLEENVENNPKLSEKYAGKLPSDVADDLQNYVNESRNQWNNRDI
jgi:hypothetical protein